jgi:hypothetical protein
MTTRLFIYNKHCKVSHKLTCFFKTKTRKEGFVTTKTRKEGLVTDESISLVVRNVIDKEKSFIYIFFTRVVSGFLLSNKSLML